MRAGVLLAVFAACAPGAPDGSCLHWSDCGAGGACEYSTQHPADAFRYECSFVDESCESGRAFGEFASEGVRGQCVPHSSGFDGLCDGAMRDCDPGLQCELGRCVNVMQLDGTTGIMGALCSNRDRIGGDVYVWGISLVLGTALVAPGPLADAQPLFPPPDPPAPVIGPFEATSITVGTTHVCAIGETAGGVERSECFGRPNDPAVTTQPAIHGDWFFLNPPITMAVGTDYALMSGGKTHTCGSKGRGVNCWGVNDDAQLDGIGTEPDLSSVPNASIGDQAVTHMTTGQNFTCIGTTSETSDVWCWGAELNWADATFDGVKGSVARVSSEGFTPGPVTALDAGESHVCAIKGGQLWCWGGNNTGQASGEATAIPIDPTQPLGDIEVIAVAAGQQHTCAVTADHRVMCWGDNAQGQLGRATASTAPVEVELEARPIGAKLLAAGDNHTCALLEDSWIHCWGAPEFTTEATPTLDLTRFVLCF